MSGGYAVGLRVGVNVNVGVYVKVAVFDGVIVMADDVKATVYSVLAP
jgi:hypothetical protein